MQKLTLTLPALAGLMLPGSALAYVGPGLGAGTLGVIIGFVGSILLALFAIVWFPVKRMLKKRQGDSAAAEQDSTSPARREGDHDGEARPGR
jgi:hypothetical protein